MGSSIALRVEQGAALIHLDALPAVALAPAITVSSWPRG